ncbi:VanW family protein [Uliginosibacterium gangwonense]|uniref:VanW family protein n=1 Tax=Uliginosibacterium gangwonense TaxID=392736 RepID=UPI0003738C2C|nr:VanW family protein [Uliginosibacterium gangwonense]
MSFTHLIRRLIPLPLRQDIRQFLRNSADRWHGIHFGQTLGDISCAHPIRLEQRIMPSPLYENKLTNIRRAIALLDHNLIAPGEQWSFWHRIRCPDAKNGFVIGRNLVNGQLTEQTGGGLCQISSLAYHLALLAGLTITERHAHSIDIYTEEQRFTPLGSDATVVWGFKDLRLHNPHPFAIAMRFAVVDGALHGEIHTQQALLPRRVEFTRETLPNTHIKVHTQVDGACQTSTVYIPLRAY